MDQQGLGPRSNRLRSTGSDTENIIVDVKLDTVGQNFVERCISAIEDMGLQTEGLYRTCGSHPLVNAFVNSELVDEDTKSQFDRDADLKITTLTSGIKTYLRNLPEPLLTFELYDRLIKTVEAIRSGGQVQDVKHLIDEMPTANRELLEVLVRHLKTVAERQSHNLMTVANLATCFGPTLMWPRDRQDSSMQDIKGCNSVVETIVLHCDQIFNDAKESGSQPHEEGSNPQSESGSQPHQEASIPKSESIGSERLSNSDAVNNEGISLGSTGGTEETRHHTTAANDREDVTSTDNAWAMYDCEAEGELELSFSRGQRLELVRLSPEPGWFVASLGDKRGLVPANYLRFS